MPGAAVRRCTASQVAQEKALVHPQITVRYRTSVKAFRGDGQLLGVVLQDLGSGGEEEAHPAAVFVFIGLQPNTTFLRDVVALTDAGFCATSPTLETNVAGIFAAGDARAGSTKQLVSAAEVGGTTALMIRQNPSAAHEAWPTGEHD
ncbi:MAG TPA: NAD(P)/FAD-dependent oxidoreductase [Herpetosiphonaceae bacterium]|nr:NAD(P)/FAD-dependent oxidoreductase [Herpetosiphonaceae bacterium]